MPIWSLGRDVKQVTKARHWFEGLVRWISKRRTTPRTPIALWVAAGVFVAVSLFAVMTFPYDAGDIRWTLLVWTALLVPATAALNGLEFYLSAKIRSLEVTLAQSVRIGLYGSAANNLPIPGSAVVRIGALKRMGSTLRQAGFVTVTIGIIWLASAASLAGILVWSEQPGGAGLTLTLVGVGLGVFAGIYLIRSSESIHAEVIVVGIVLVEAALVITTALRFFIALSALGVDATAGQSAILALSVVVAAALGIAPGGLGVRELVAGFLAPLISIEVSIGVAATVLDRTVALIGFAVLSIVFGFFQSRADQEQLTKIESKR